MHPTAEQIEFIRRHGITYCPPAPQIEMPWRSSRDAWATERDIIVGLAQLDPMDFRPYRNHGPLYWKIHEEGKVRKVNGSSHRLKSHH